MRRLIQGVITVLAVFWLVCPAGAEDKDFLVKPWEKGYITLGGFISGTDSSVRLGLPGVGLKIDVEEVLGLQTTTTVFRTDAMWRFSENLKHRADFTWFSLARDGETTLGQDLPIGGGTIPAGTDVQTSFDLDIFKLGYSYSYFQDNRMDLAAGIGLFVAPISFDLVATGAVNQITSESVTAPLPVFSLRADFAITPKLFLKNNIDFFYMEIGDFRGSIYDWKINLEYNWFEHFGIGAGVETFDLKLEAQGNDYPGIDFVGQFGFRYSGLMLYGKLYY